MEGAALAVLCLVVGALIAAKGVPLAAQAIEGRRIEEAVRAQDVLRLRQALSGTAGLAELGRILTRLRTGELLALGDKVAADAADERGTQALALVAEIVERRESVRLRWLRLREQPAAEEERVAR
jgi:hypothetical protein